MEHEVSGSISGSSDSKHRQRPRQIYSRLRFFIHLVFFRVFGSEFPVFVQATRRPTYVNSPIVHTRQVQIILLTMAMILFSARSQLSSMYQRKHQRHQIPSGAQSNNSSAWQNLADSSRSLLRVFCVVASNTRPNKLMWKLGYSLFLELWSGSDGHGVSDVGDLLLIPIHPMWSLWLPSTYGYTKKYIHPYQNHPLTALNFFREYDNLCLENFHP